MPDLTPVRLRRARHSSPATWSSGSGPGFAALTRAGLVAVDGRVYGGPPAAWALPLAPKRLARSRQEARDDEHERRIRALIDPSRSAGDPMDGPLSALYPASPRLEGFPSRGRSRRAASGIGPACLWGSCWLRTLPRNSGVTERWQPIPPVRPAQHPVVPSPARPSGLARSAVCRRPGALGVVALAPHVPRQHAAWVPLRHQQVKRVAEV